MSLLSWGGDQLIKGEGGGGFDQNWAFATTFRWLYTEKKQQIGSRQSYISLKSSFHQLSKNQHLKDIEWSSYNVILDFFLMETRLKVMKMVVSLWGQNMTLNCDIPRTSWHIKVSDGSLFWIFHALLFEPNLYWTWNSPLRLLSAIKLKRLKVTVITEPSIKTW